MYLIVGWNYGGRVTSCSHWPVLLTEVCLPILISRGQNLLAVFFPPSASLQEQFSHKSPFPVRSTGILDQESHKTNWQLQCPYVSDLHHAKPDHATNMQFPTRTGPKKLPTVSSVPLANLSLD